MGAAYSNIYDRWGGYCLVGGGGVLFGGRGGGGYCLVGGGDGIIQGAIQGSCLFK